MSDADRLGKGVDHVCRRDLRSQDTGDLSVVDTDRCVACAALQIPDPANAAGEDRLHYSAQSDLQTLGRFGDVGPIVLRLAKLYGASKKP